MERKICHSFPPPVVFLEEDVSAAFGSITSSSPSSWGQMGNRSETGDSAIAVANEDDVRHVVMRGGGGGGQRRSGDHRLSLRRERERHLTLRPERRQKRSCPHRQEEPPAERNNRFSLCDVCGCVLFAAAMYVRRRSLQSADDFREDGTDAVGRLFLHLSE